MSGTVVLPSRLHEAMATIHIEELNEGVDKTIEFAQPMVKIGRVHGNDIILSSRSISKWHAEICFSENNAIIYDRNSRNGVYVNGSKICSPTHLNSDDNIRIGEYVIRIKQIEMSASSNDIFPSLVLGNELLPPSKYTNHFVRRVDQDFLGQFRQFFPPKTTPDETAQNRTQTSRVLVPTKMSIRKFIGVAFPTDSDFEALCLDHFHNVHSKFSSSMDRVAKLNLLLTVEPSELILARIKKYYPEKRTQYAFLIQFENE